MTKKLSTRAARIVAAGKLRYGDTRWQSPLARLTGLSPALLQKIADGTREVTDDVYRKVAEGIAKEADRVRAVGLKLDKLALAMLKELEE
jgi:hypothetical protein